MSRLIYCVIALIVACMVCVASPVLAQPAEDAFAEPTEAQVKLYTAAIEAFKAKNFGEAIDLLKSSLALGELNIIYLNLGRAYHSNGQCDLAEETYRKAAMSPKVADPSPDVIAAKLKEFEAELATSCPGTVKVACTPATMTISVDNGAPVPCSTVLKLEPGEHVINGVDGDMKAQARVKVQSRQSQTVTLNATESSTSGSPLTTAGIFTAGGGLAVVAAGVLVDILVLAPAIDDYGAAVEAGSADEQSLRDDAESLQGTVLAVYIVGGIGVAAGATMVALGMLGDESAEASTSRVEPWITPEGGAGVGWSVAW